MAKPYGCSACTAGKFKTMEEFAKHASIECRGLAEVVPDQGKNYICLPVLFIYIYNISFE